MNLPPNPAAWPKRWRELYEERCGIIEFQANLSRETAELSAQMDIRKQAAEEQRGKVNA